MVEVEVPKEMLEKYKDAVALIEKSEDIKIYSHIDCDGMCSGAILSTILDRLDKEHEIEFVNLDVLEDIPLTHELTIFSDLGSGQPVDKNASPDNSILILDHHPPLHDIDYNKSLDYEYIEINCNYYNINGSEEICGGGLCYLLAKTYGFKDLSWIGVLSAIGDMQNSKQGKLVGLNDTILQDAVKEGYVNINQDLNLYGRETRPIQIALSYFSDVKLPFTNDRNESIRILRELDILKPDDEGYKTLSDLTIEEKTRLLRKWNEMLGLAVPPRYVKYIPKLITCDTYDFIKEEKHTFLYDASEFSTSMNACGRNQRYEVALRILKGDRSEEAMLDLIDVTKEHKYNISKSVKIVTEKLGISEMDNIQYVDAEGVKGIHVIGTVIGMVIGYGDWRKPILGFADIRDNEDLLKVSLRCSRLLAYDGIHFGNIIRKIAKSVGGNGGGHNVACGAYIPKDRKEEFINLFDKELDGKLEV